MFEDMNTQNEIERIIFKQNVCNINTLCVSRKSVSLGIQIRSRIAPSKISAKRTIHSRFRRKMQNGRFRGNTLSK